ncbi:MAG: hypothetical protein A3E78_01230 [Alphaproteobacteria bacterium RIFCSPHIGHO2_12_FULL_63_12]|nr:MAG: hypothetical protein A3E78_01230 [Alphaproteobacteria bacterium RIFCSPHIGHO2_12_FULL_63_12]
MGLGAVGALAAAVTTGVYVNESGKTAPAAATATRAAPNTVCIESNVRLVDGMSPGCRTPAQFEALRDRAVIDGDGGAISVNLAAPDGAGDDAMARTCAEFDALTVKGWYALSGADMRREGYFNRACGALSYLAKAAPAQSTHFAGGKASAEDIRSMAMEEATGFGEAEPSTAVNVNEIEDRVWKVEIGQGETMVYEIAHADFTGDGLGEILAYVSVGAAGGTARTGTIGLLEKSSDGGACVFRAR